MSFLGIGRGSSTRTVRKIEAPRPLKTVNVVASNEAKKQPLSSLVLPAKAIDSGGIIEFSLKMLTFYD